MDTVLSLACVVGSTIVGIMIGRRLSRSHSIQLNVAAMFSFLIAVVVALAYFQSQPIFLACVCSLAASALAAAWTQSGAELEGREKEREEAAARQRGLNAPNQPFIGDGVQSRSSSRSDGGFKRARQVDYLRLVAMNYNVPYKGRKGRAKLHSVKKKP
jgi:hypothetical protein